MENEESNLNAGRRGPKNNGVGNPMSMPDQGASILSRRWVSDYKFVTALTTLFL